MPREVDKLTSLPTELLKKIQAFSGESTLSVVNHSSHRLFHSKTAIVKKIANHVVSGEEDAIKTLLSRSPRSIHHVLTRGDILDLSGRSFSNVSAFQYAVWALDARMWETMLSALKTAHLDESRALQAEFLAQHEEICTRGISYLLNGSRFLQSHFDFTPLIEAWQAYIENHDTWTFERREHHWCSLVGTAELQVPAHVAQMLCDKERSLDPTPSFKNKKQSRSLLYYNQLTKKEEPWWPQAPADNPIGVSLAICRGNSKGAMGVTSRGTGRVLFLGFGGAAGVVRLNAHDLDLQAIVALSLARIKDSARLRDSIIRLFQAPSLSESLLGFVRGI